MSPFAKLPSWLQPIIMALVGGALTGLTNYLMGGGQKAGAASAIVGAAMGVFGLNHEKP